MTDDATKEIVRKRTNDLAQIPDFFKDVAGELGVIPLADPEISPSPSKGAANRTKPTSAG